MKTDRMLILLRAFAGVLALIAFAQGSARGWGALAAALGAAAVFVVGYALGLLALRSMSRAAAPPDDELPEPPALAGLPPRSDGRRVLLRDVPEDSRT